MENCVNQLVCIVVMIFQKQIQITNIDFVDFAGWYIWDWSSGSWGADTMHCGAQQYSKWQRMVTWTDNSRDRPWRKSVHMW